MKIKFTKHAEKDLSVLQKTDRERILKAVYNFRKNPENADLKKLKGSSDTWRLRVGKFRVIFQTDRSDDTIYVFKISHRKNVYR